MLERIKVFFWRLLYYPGIRIRYFMSRAIRVNLKVLNSTETISLIKEGNLSVSRFGDGEFQMISHYMNGGDQSNFPVDSFQDYDSRLAKRLKEILCSQSEGHLVCIPYAFKDSSISKLADRMFWEREWNIRINLFTKVLHNNLFGDTNFTRFYMGRKDILNYPQYIQELRSLWEDKDILIVEWKMSRLGVGNDLFGNAKSLKRIICPEKNAFQCYEKIFGVTAEHCHNRLVLIALGHSATVLAYDLCKINQRAIDIGHVDIEYEWYRMNATKKVVVANKYVNEVMEGRFSNDLIDNEYTNSIVEIIK